MFFLLPVICDAQADNPAIGAYVSKIRSHEMLPWTDWITKHLNDAYGSLRGVGPARVKEEDLLEMKGNLRYWCRLVVFVVYEVLTMVSSRT